jgi:ABC-2 type transport system permease protein
MKEIVIAVTGLRRTLRERSSIFFLALFPMVMILVLGVAFGGTFTPRIGIVQPSSPLSEHLGGLLSAEPGIQVRLVADEATLVDAVERGELEAGVVLPTDINATVRYLARQEASGRQVWSIVAGVLDREAARQRATSFVVTQTGSSTSEAEALIESVAVAPIPVTVTSTGDVVSPPGRFESMAAAELLLFVFLVAMTSSVALVETRRLGITRRMLSTATSSAAIVRGEALARLMISLIQAAIIMAGSALFFDVAWGDPLAAGSLVLAFSLVASGVGLLLGALASTPQVATGVGLLLGLGTAALGGTMVPLEFFPPTMHRVAHLTPHAWALDGFATLIRRGGGIGDIVTELSVLGGAAVALFAIAGYALRRRLAR